jgi:biopolymer transport protein ExbD
MLISNNKPLQQNGDDNLIPLINIVFLMLIFFMVAGHISASDAIKTSPPSSVSDLQREQSAIEIIVGLNQQLIISNETVHITQLTEKIIRFFQQSADPKTFSLLIKADKALPVDELKQVLLAVKLSGIKKVSLATQLVAENND